MQNDKVGNDAKKVKLSAGIEELRGIDQIEWDSWNGEDDPIEDTSSGGTKTDSSGSYHTSFTSLPIKVDEQTKKSNEQKEPEVGIGRKRTLCRIIG